MGVFHWSAIAHHGKRRHSAFLLFPSARPPQHKKNSPLQENSTRSPHRQIGLGMPTILKKPSRFTTKRWQCGRDGRKDGGRSERFCMTATIIWRQRELSRELWRSIRGTEAPGSCSGFANLSWGRTTAHFATSRKARNSVFSRIQNFNA